MFLRTLLFIALLACHSATPVTPTASAHVAATPPAPPAPQRLDLDSRDILAREIPAPAVLVKHVLIAWSELARAYHGVLDPRARDRSQADAARLAEEVAAKLRANPTAIDVLIDAHSEDPASRSHEPYEIKSGSSLVAPFKNLGLRLEMNEVGIVTTEFGYHVMIRVAPTPPDPLESADILARPATSGPVDVQQIMIGWEGLDPTRDEIEKPRTKAEAAALASELLAKVRAGGDMRALMKQYSEDPGSNATGKAYSVSEDTGFVARFKDLALRLDAGEAGLIKTGRGWHIVKRLVPPPPDPLESVEILKRNVVADHVKVKHILLGWKEVNSEDPRGAARTRAQLEKLVKATVKKLKKKGASFEAAMSDLSEDPGSAKSGEAYEASTDAALVKPFLNLSLRLQVNEIGVVKTDYGIHIIKRVD